MTTMTATADPSRAAVDLHVTKTDTVARILRIDRNGIAEVRGLAGMFPSAGAGELILTDYEAAHGQNSYQCVDAAGTVLASAGAELVLDGPWLYVPVVPNYSSRADAVTAYSSGRAAASTIHRVPGRPDPLVTIGKLGTRTGSMTIYAGTLAAGRDLEDVLARGEVVMLRQRVDGLDMYFTATNTQMAPVAVTGEESTRWQLSVQYVEVARPTGPLQGSLGWDLTALAAAFPSLDAVAVAYADLDALALDERL